MPITAMAALFLLSKERPWHSHIRDDQAKCNTSIATFNAATLLKSAKTYIMQCLNIAK